MKDQEKMKDQDRLNKRSKEINYINEGTIME